ncbi:Subtilisin-like protease 2 [Fusarium oxysporum f. sp. cubense race 1]|uniref:Subtilisin-like protease 2 n=1 Tax=Fusarium oxysporum f. sp. cubense (strain race 1) TaxID=1229664 RepID=N4TLR9_FUSC1|nr:Subtilisin-like protease 2 [Fusarium oxysporum f. sp. cubense race 1]
MKFTLLQFIGLALVFPATTSPVKNKEVAVRDAILEPNSDSSIIKGRAVSASANYLIYPKANSAMKDVEAFSKSLQSQAGKTKVDTLTDANGKLLAWYATLSANQVAVINKSSVVGSIAPDAPLRTKAKSSGVAKRALKTDKKAQPELQMFSTAPGKKPSGYAYDDKAGQGVTIYVLDEGFNLRHKEFTSSPGRKRWIFSKGASGENDPDGHGSCCASKALGSTVGVAPKADLVAVKLQLTSWSLLKAWQAVILDVKQNRLQGKAVALDVVVVSSSGNFGTQFEVSTYPSLFANRTPIIVTGAVDNNGRLAPFSQGGPLVTTTAPGVAVKCAAMSGASAYQAGKESTGTSFSTPAVAGLAAYFLSLDSLRPRLQVPGSVAMNVKALIQEHHYARVSGGPKVAWNAHTLLRN